MTAKTPEEIKRLEGRCEDTRRHLDEAPNEAAGFWGIDACSRISDLLDYVELLKSERDEAWRKGAEAMRVKAFRETKRASDFAKLGLCGCECHAIVMNIPTPEPEGE